MVEKKTVIASILAVRHGETQWNTAGKMQGHLNSDLTDKGIMQARTAAKNLQKLQIDKFYCSDLARATQTASIITESLGIPYEEVQDLRERNLGVFQGLTRDDAKFKYPDAYRSYKQYPHYQIPDGESFAEQYNRCVQCIESIAKQNQGKTILIVTHGGILSCLMYKTFRLPLYQERVFKIPNASINKFLISENNEWCLESWGCQN